MDFVTENFCLCVRHKFEMSDIQAVSVSTLGSTIALKKLPQNEKSGEYDPFAHRSVAHPTT